MYPFPYDRIKVPYLGDDVEECNESNFIDYPTRHNVAPAELRKRGAGYHPQELGAIAALLQQWLVFGVMKALFATWDMTINTDDFLFAPGQEGGDSMDLASPGPGSVGEGLDDEVPRHDADSLEESSTRYDEGHPHHDDFMSPESHEEVDESCLRLDSGTGRRSSTSHEPLVVDMGYIRVLRHLIYLRAKEFFIDNAARRVGLRSQHLSIFDSAEAALQELVSWRTEFYPAGDPTIATDSPLVDNVILSAIMLTEYLYATVMDVFPSPDGIARRSLYWPLDNALRRRLLNSGWRPGEIATLFNKFRHVTSLYLVGSLDRRCLARHHSRCTPDLCVANQIDSTTYKTKHVSPGCDCDMVEDTKGGAASAVQILQSGGMPVVVVTTSPDGKNSTLSIIASENVRYVAISHVWSDGLGNPRRNALPTCQLQRIQQWVDDLYPESPEHVPFWIDTLCVPLDVQVRKQAVRLMGETYRASDKVLVLDEWLIETGFSDLLELDLLKLKSCTWNQRLWTLQEGMLAKRDSLCFQTQGGSSAEGELYQDFESGVEHTVMVLQGLVGQNGDTLQVMHHEIAAALLESLNRHIDIWEDPVSPAHGFLTKYHDTANPEDQNEQGLISQLHSWLAHSFVWIEGRDYFSSLRRPLGLTSPGLPDHTRSAPINRSNEVMEVGHNMKNRSTSRIEDEAVCSATLLGLDLRAILDCPSAQGRMGIAFSQLEHVSAMIVFSHSPRIDREGFRWAPATFRENAKAYRPGVTFMNSGEMRPEGLVVRFDAIVFGRGAGSNVAVPATQAAVDSVTLTIRQVGQRGLYSPSQRVWDAALLYGEHGATVSTLDTDAILTELLRTEGDVILGRLLGHYHIRCEGPRDAGTLEELTGIARERQRWCIG